MLFAWGGGMSSTGPSNNRACVSNVWPWMATFSAVQIPSPTCAYRCVLVFQPRKSPIIVIVLVVKEEEAAVVVVVVAVEV